MLVIKVNENYYSKVSKRNGKLGSCLQYCKIWDIFIPDKPIRNSYQNETSYNNKYSFDIICAIICADEITLVKLTCKDFYTVDNSKQKMGKINLLNYEIVI